MASVFPFAALRPTPDVAAAVAAVPYDVVSTDEARALAAGRPLSFLHVSRAEIDLPADTNPYADVVYETASARFAALRREAPLVVEAEPSLYVYRLVMGPHSQSGIAGCFSVDEYETDVIRRHEKTRRDKEDDRTRHILELRAQTGPVFLTYPASGAVDAIASAVAARPPLIDFTADDGIRHTVWRAGSSECRGLVEAFGRVPHLYIADGHHRVASAARTRQALREREGRAGEWDRFLAVAFPHDQVQVLAYNRIVKDLQGRTPEAFLEALFERCAVTSGPPVPARKGDVSMFIDGRWHTIALNQVAEPRSPIDTLDCSLLEEQVLAPLLGIADVRTDKRIDFVGGIRGTGVLEAAVTSGAAAVAFSMYPVSVADLMAISDAGEIMPPKSTWFEPKLRDGLLVHCV